MYAIRSYYGKIAEDLDVKVVTGSGSNPDTLREAGILGADILLAVTDSDESYNFV